jgi:flagellar motility protein MotE (MotC chaperone)
MPALIAISVGSLALKAVDVAEAATEADDKKEEKSEEVDLDAEPHIDDDTHHEDEMDLDELTDIDYGNEPGSENCIAAPDFTTETGLSQYEIDVLRSLADRRQELEKQAEQIETREQMAAAAEARLEEQINELKELESGIQVLLASMDQKRDERLDGLVNVYQSMKAKDAARIFEKLDDDVLLEVSQRMKHAQLGAVMAAMSSEKAQYLTLLLAERAELPETADDVLNNAEAG